jgi:hypothetical protein
MTKPRALKLKDAHLFTQEGDSETLILSGQTVNGVVHQIIVSDLGIASAQCAIATLAGYLAAKIASERATHRLALDRVAGAWRKIDTSLKETTP